MTLIHGLIKRTQCRAVFSLAVRVKGGFELHYIPAPEGIYSPDVHESLKALNEGVQACIALCPAQYQWEYKRFKMTPEGKKPYYQGF